MEITKAISIIKNSRNMQCDCDDCVAEREAFEMAIKALKREIPMYILNNDENCGIWKFDCPACKTHYSSYVAWKYCPMCGQQLEY